MTPRNSRSVARDAPGSGGGAVAGLLLTGGTSSRLGIDKATLEIDGESLARRTGRILTSILGYAIEVGPGVSGLPAVTETPRGAGPLVALTCGSDALARSGHGGPVLLVATDLPHLTGELVAFLASLPGESSVVPVVDGRAQPLCARWSRDDIRLAAELVSGGSRSLMALLDHAAVDLIGPETWGVAADAAVFADIDTLDDLDRVRRNARPAEPPEGPPSGPSPPK